MQDNDYEQEDPSVEEAPVLKGHGRVSARTRSTPRPYVVTGIDARGRKIRKRAPWNTAREEARRATRAGATESER